MNTRLLAFRGQRLRGRSRLVELWFHMLVCTLDQQAATPASGVLLRKHLVAIVHNVKRGRDIDLDSALEPLVDVSMLIALSASVVRACPKEPNTILPAAQLWSLAPQGGIWSGDYETWAYTTAQVHLFGRQFIALLHGLLPATCRFYQAVSCSRTDIMRATRYLRSAYETRWLCLRALLRGEGFDPQHLWLVVLQDHDAVTEYGIFVTTHKEVYAFYYTLMDAASADGDLSSIWNMTHAWTHLPERAAITLTLELIDAEAQMHG
jgi:hypothetical protein